MVRDSARGAVVCSQLKGRKETPVNPDAVLTPQFHLRPDEELIIGVEADSSGMSWNLRIELLLRVSDTMLHRYGPVWIDPETIEGSDPDSLEDLIRETLTSTGYEEEPLEPGAGRIG